MKSGLKIENRLHRSWIPEQAQTEAKSLKNGLDCQIIAQHLSRYSAQFLVSGDVDESTHQFGSEVLMLALV